ncbi:fas-binding factor 1 [Eupeodes corollae]|uniref:fas-binding factor 1 n=1 Tax=Eupeodes corollae TaxID=290404 RepID=UPI002490DD83|nr:fas-binding factor 1 [Eupeodes corollae]
MFSNLDDPLADLLSDNSNDNDSFFDNQPGKKKAQKKPPSVAGRASGGGGKGKMEDLFGIKEESEPQFKVPPIRTPLITGSGSKKEEKPPLATSTPKPKTKPNDDVDILSDLGFDPKNPKSTVASKSNLFDDILSSIDSKKPSSSGKATEELNVVRRDDGVVSTRGTISRQSTETTDNSGNVVQTRPKTSTGRRSSTASPAKNSTFDLFSRDNDSLRVPAQKSRKKASTADWLGLGNDNESEEEPSNVEVLKIPDNLPTKPEVRKINEEVETETLSVPDLEPEVKIVPPEVTPLPHHLMTTVNMGTQNVAQIIDQQMTQLTLASQMKNQEAALMEMQRRQYDLISRQETQFNELLQKQLSRQNQLEQSIKSQQERINAHIQLLLSQPISASFVERDQSVPTSQDQNVASSQEKSEALIELQADVRRLELEKLRLEDLVSTINANYEKEIEIIEKSFKKQISVLEEHLASVETRLKNENAALHEFYSDQLKNVNIEKIDMKARLEGNLNDLRKTHEEEIRRIKSNHEEDMDGLKDDHRKMIETIRQSKLFEFAAVQENGSYLETLRMASSNLESVTGDLQSLKSEMERKIDSVHREREMRLNTREKKVEDSERRIQQLESANEEEKTRLMELVTTLESQLKQLSKDSSEENWIMRQKMAALEAEKITFEKEKTLIREQMAKDEKRIEELKEDQLQEKQRLMEQIHEERVQLNIEKAKIETAKKLESHTSIEQSRLEIEASLKVAQDVTRQAEAERERFFKLQRQFEAQKRSLIDKENEIRFKEQELEQDILQARASERRANEATQKARLSEQNFNEKVTFLQQKLRELSEKESRLSQERLKLSQERIDLQNMRSKLEQNRCSLCRIGERNGELSQVLRPSLRGIDGIPVIDDNQYFMESSRNGADVDRFLDENVSISLERLKNTSNHNWEDQVEAMRPSSNAGDPSVMEFDFSKFLPTNDYMKN